MIPELRIDVLPQLMWVILRFSYVFLLVLEVMFRQIFTLELFS